MTAGIDSVKGTGVDGQKRQPRRLLVIYNPRAAGPARRRFVAWLGQLEALGVRTLLRATAGAGDPERLARAADPGEVDAVVVAGGDGSINEALNGLAESPLPLAILPLGTANVLAAEIGLPRDMADLARIAAFAPPRPVWPGEAVAESGGAARRFLIMAGIGFDAEVVERLDLAWKRRVGKLAYVASILGRLREDHRSTYRVVIDGAHAEAASLIAAKAHFYGGRFVLAPTARLDEPAFHVVLFERAGRRAAFGYLAAMVMGTLPRARGVRVIAAKTVRLREPAGAPVQLDGDIRLHLPVTLRVAERPFALICPPD